MNLKDNEIQTSYWSDRKFFIITWVIAMTILIGGLLTIKHRYEHIVNIPTNVKAIAK